MSIATDMRVAELEREVRDLKARADALEAQLRTLASDFQKLKGPNAQRR